MIDRIEVGKHVPVSVIIPCYRCAETIQRAVDSVIAQTLPPEEIILVDDFSNDEGVTLDALDQIRQVHQEANIKILRLDKNRGAGSARNAGWEESSKSYIAFLDADDEWKPEKLEVQYKYMQENPKIAVTGHRYIVFLNDKPTEEFVFTFSYKKISPLSLLFKNCFPTSSVMLKNKIPFRFTDEKRCAEDFYLWQQVALAGFPIVRIEVPLVRYHKSLYGSGGLSANLWKMEKGELDNFIALYQSGNINWLLFIAAMSFSITKFVKRLIIAWLNRIGG